MTDKHPPLTMSMFGSKAAYHAECLYQALCGVMPYAERRVYDLFESGDREEAARLAERRYMRAKQVIENYKENK